LVLVTGPSSAGKSGLVRRLAERIGERARTVSLDGLLAALGAGGRCPASLEEAERAGLLSAAGYHRLLADALAKPGLVLCDHVLCGSSAWTQDLLHRLAAKTPGARLVAIELDCPEDELRARERARSDRPADCAHAAAQRRRQAAKPLAAILETLPGTNLTILSGSSPGTGHALPAQAQPGRAAMDSVTTGSMTADCVTLDSGAAGPDALAEQAFAALERRGLLPHISRQSRQGSEV
ncbi:MAG: AAA family ATPase, partial [Desulfovibrionaceae bacterium]|nr:AAA family ATPase [Desulfovibrionaceae bacterium]